MRDRIGIIVPVKRVNDIYLNIALKSAIMQTSPAWDLYVVVTKTTPQSNLDIINRYKDKRIKIILDQGRMLAGAINTAMNRMDNEFVGLLLGDDYWKRNAVEVLLKNISKHQKIDFFHSSRRIIDEKGRYVSGIYRSRNNFEIKDFWKGSPVKHLLCWRRSKALEIGGLDEIIHFGSDDYDFPWRMAEAGATFKNIEECLYFHRAHISLENERLTTHIPFDIQVSMIIKRFKKHNVPKKETRIFIEEAKRSFLKQCLFVDERDKKAKLAGIKKIASFQREPYISVDSQLEL